MTFNFLFATIYDKIIGCNGREMDSCLCCTVFYVYSCCISYRRVGLAHGLTSYSGTGAAYRQFLQDYAEGGCLCFAACGAMVSAEGANGIDINVGVVKPAVACAGSGIHPYKVISRGVAVAKVAQKSRRDVVYHIFENVIVAVAKIVSYALEQHR